MRRTAGEGDVPITQIPRTIYVVSLGRTKTVLTPVGTFSVHRLPPELFGGFEERADGSQTDACAAAGLPAARQGPTTRIQTRTFLANATPRAHNRGKTNEQGAEAPNEGAGTPSKGGAAGHLEGRR